VRAVLDRVEQAAPKLYERLVLDGGNVRLLMPPTRATQSIAWVATLAHPLLLRARGG
jgi:hypothetical protein